MKKMGIFVGAILLALAVLTSAQISKAESSGDQSCVLAGSDYDLISPETTPREQSFIPTQNRLEMVNVWLNGPGFAGDQAVVVSVLNSNKETLGSSEFYPNFEKEGALIRTGEYNPAIVLTPGQVYYIKVDVLDGPNNLYWYRSIGDCYASGAAIAEFVEMSWDFLFMTYGYTYTAPSTPATTTTPTTTDNTSTTSSNSSATTVTIPQTSTSTTIKTPTAPSAVYDGENKTISVSWKASATTNIDGYIISRSTDNQTFSDLGMTTKAVLSYTDQAVIAGQTYYYKVRAYKGSLSSVSSDVISAAVPVAEAAATVSTEKSTDQPVAEEEGFFTSRNIILMAGSFLVLLLVILEIMIVVARKRGVRVAELFKKTKNPSSDTQ